MRFDETQYVAGQRITNQGRDRPFAPPHVPFNHYSGSGHNYGAGITYQNRPDAIAIARRACGLMDQGHAEADVIKSMAQANPGLTDDVATRFTHIAESTYSPQHVNAPPQPQPPQGPAVPPFFPWPPIPSL